MCRARDGVQATRTSVSSVVQSCGLWWYNARALALNRRDWTFLVIAGAVIGVLVVLSMMGKKPPLISAIPAHAAVTNESKRTECVACHDPRIEGVVAPLPASHPTKWRDEKTNCTLCHKTSPASTASAALPLAQETKHQ